MRTSRFRQSVITFAIIAWGMSVSVGFGVLMDYSFAPGPETRVEGQLSSAVRTALDLEPGRPAIIVLAHVGCPCTRATLAELERALVQSDSPVQARVVCTYPESKGLDWARNRAVWRIASRIRGVLVVGDASGRLARSLGIGTSGHVLLYDAGGHLLFSGGITPARGHEGGNMGRSALVARVRGEHRSLATSPVFGCALFSDSELLDTRQELTQCR